MDSAFSSVIRLERNADILQIWRIEKMKLVPISKSAYGKFFTGDSYIVFSRKNREDHIHFWLGNHTSQDEATTAAYKTVELDNALGNFPTQHREVQGFESKRFISYFKKGQGVIYLEGGVASGLNPFIRDTTSRLYEVKGKRDPMIVRQLEKVSWDMMNSGDVYVLEARSENSENERIFVWRGAESNYYERLHGAKLAGNLKDENSINAVVIVDDNEEASLPSEDLAIFEQHLPLNKKNNLLKNVNDVIRDVEASKTYSKEVKLYEINFLENNSLTINEIDNGFLKQSSLKSEKAYIIDYYIGKEIWVWIGDKSKILDKKEAIRTGHGFIKKKDYNANIPLTIVVEFTEPVEFKHLFKEWKHKFTGPSQIKKVPMVFEKFNVSNLHKHPDDAAKIRMPDDGTGTKEVFRIERRNLVSVPSESISTFYSGDCYVVLYSYKECGKENYIIYYWLGSQSSQDERGTAAIKAVELDDHLGGKPVQVRVIQGKEPAHFLAMFDGKFKVLLGGISSKFDGHVEGQEVNNTNKPMLLQIYGSEKLLSRATEVECSASNLNTNDCFLLYDIDSTTYIWYGKGSTGDEREAVKSLAPFDHEAAYEGHEKEEFWKILGGKKPYLKEKMAKPYDINKEFKPRLFQGSNASGVFRMEEIFDFNQRDLISDDVMLLDAGDSIFVWIGSNSNEREKKAIYPMVDEYLSSDPSGRDMDTPITTVKEGEEPIFFRGFFGAWDFFWAKNTFQ